MFDNNLLQKAYFHCSNDIVSELISYINYVSGNDLKSSIIRQYVFSVKWKPRDNKIRSRCNCKAASNYLCHLLDAEEGISSEKIKMIIAEIRPHVAILDSAQKTSFVFSTNTLPSTIHYKHAQNLFYKNDLSSDSKNNYDSDLLVLYALRLSLEKRLRGFLGIDYATFNGKPLGVSRLLDVAKGLDSIHYAKDISWQEIEWVNTWLNHHMHRNLRPYPWTIHQAFEVLNSLLLPSKYVNGNSTMYSYYASTVVSDIEVLNREIATKLESNGKGVKIMWAKDREVLTIK